MQQGVVQLAPFVIHQQNCQIKAMESILFRYYWVSEAGLGTNHLTKSECTTCGAWCTSTTTLLLPWKDMYHQSIIDKNDKTKALCLSKQKAKHTVVCEWSQKVLKVKEVYGTQKIPIKLWNGLSVHPMWYYLEITKSNKTLLIKCPSNQTLFIHLLHIFSQPFFSFFESPLSENSSNPTNR